jgi:hypothetical protein
MPYGAKAWGDGKVRERDEYVLLIAALACASGVIHVIASAEHFSEYWLFGVFFALLAPLQVIWGAYVVAMPRVDILTYGAICNGLVAVLWTISRTVGLPIGPMHWTPEVAGLPDVLSTLDEALIVILCGWVLVGCPAVGRPRGARVGVIALAVASLLAYSIG